MMKTLTVILCLAIAQQGYSQTDTSAVASRFIMQISGGTSTGISSVRKGYNTDNLLGYSNHTAAINLNVSCFFSRHWGITSYITLNLPFHNTSAADFSGTVTQKYQENYFTTLHTYDINTTPSLSSLGIGPTYRLQKNKYVLLMRAMAGIMSYSTGSAWANLKGKGNNDYTVVNWSRDPNNPGDYSEKDPFCFSTSVMLGYRFMPHFLVTAEVGYAVSTVNINYTETMSSTVRPTTATVYSYHGAVNQLNWGIGLAYTVGANSRR